MTIQTTEATMLVQEKTALDKTRARADRASAKSDSSSTMFDKVLRAFAIGDLSFSDLESSLSRLLKDGAPPDELLGVLRWRESIEPLQDAAREKIIAVLHEAQPQSAAANTDAAERHAPTAVPNEAVHPPAPDEEPDTSSMTRLIQEFASAWDTEPRARPTARIAAAPESGGQQADSKAMRLALGEREDDLAALQAEHSRVLGLLEARARSAAKLQEEVRELGAQLEQSRAAQLAQQVKTREIHQRELKALRESLAEREASLESMRVALAEREASLEAMRVALAEREAGAEATRGTVAGHDAAIEHMNQALAGRDGVIEQARQMLAERDAQLASARARIAALEADAASSTARAAREGEAWADKIIALQRILDERNLAIEAQKQQHEKVVASFMAHAKTAEAELKTARHRIDVLASELQSAGRAAASVRTMPLPREVDTQPQPVEDPRPAHDTHAAEEAVAPGVVRLRRALEIGDFSVPPIHPPPRASSWVPGPLGRLGICALLAVLGIIGWAFKHHVPAATKAPDAAAPPALAPGSVIRDCPTCPSFTVLPAGRFKQGSADTNASSAVRPVHWVAISNPIAMSTNAVTVDQFRTFVTATGRDMQGCDIYDGHWKHQARSSWQNPGFEQGGTHPVTCASWNDAKAYAQWLSAQTGQHYRLPSASEWEYAARAGSEAVQPWSANGSDACANANVADLSAARRYPGWVTFACNDGYVFTAPVGSFKPSPFGLNDMLGNVFQWTEDCWNANYKGAPLDGSARKDGNCGEHELRGGSWFSSPGYVRADYRNHFAASYRSSSAGIRLVRDITP